MGRKKIEIRPLTDERNRNVTFLKRKAGLMKKAWELSVLCAADVSLLIFSASGKAYEFSSKELDAEIDRYHDYEGMIERRRAPEFAAMALAGEDDDDEDDDTGRRSSTVKGKAGGASGEPLSGPARSLKGKETFKQRTVRGDPEAHRRAGKKGKGRAGAGGEGRSKRRAGGGGKRGLSGSGSGSERRGFIDGILSGEDSASSEEEEEDEEEARKRGRQRAKEKEMELLKWDVAERTKRRVSAERRATELPVKREHGSSSDKMIDEGLQYALGMHAAAPPSFDAHNPYAPPPGPHHTDSYASASASSSQTPLSVPQLPRLGPDAISYRMPSAPALPYSVAGVGMNVPHLPAGMTYQGHPAGMAYYSQGYYGGGGAQQLYFQQHTQQHMHQQASHGSAPPPSYLNSSQSQSSSQPPSQTYPPGAPGLSNLPTPSATGVPPFPPPGGGQWDASLLARYAEYQLQQNHQRQQRVLLERQRQQLAELGVPVDERNLLDEIFGALGAKNQSSSSSNASAHEGAGAGAGGNAGALGMDVDLSAGGRDDPTGRMDFVWPLGGGPAAHGTPTAGATATGNGGPGGWMDEPEGMDEQGNGLSLPSPLSADAGEARRKMAESDEKEGGRHKRARVG